MDVPTRTEFNYSYRVYLLYVQLGRRSEYFCTISSLQCVCACQVRAVDLAMRLHLERSYDIAIQLAQRAQSTKLAQRIHILKRAKFGELAIDSEEEEDEQGPGPFCGNIYGMQSYILSCTHKPPTV